MQNYTVRSPVLFIIFNRPDTTKRVFEKIRNAQPSRLYVAADGTRNNNLLDAQLCKEARSIVQNIDWPCEVKTLFSETNKGCKGAVSGALNWFFEQEEEGIVLEDDCLPANSFFFFCDAMLERYRRDTRVFSITGTNHQHGTTWGKATYYFSQCSNIWGWATWRRVWQQYDVTVQKYNEEDALHQFKNIFTDPFLIERWMEYFNKIKRGEIDTWDYQFHFMNFFANGLCVVPNVNLISNIGFGDDATHTHNAAHRNANLPVGEIVEIIHPQYFVPEKEADYTFLRKEFDLDEKWRKYNKRKNKLRRWWKQIVSFS